MSASKSMQRSFVGNPNSTLLPIGASTSNTGNINTTLDIDHLPTPSQYTTQRLQTNTNNTTNNGRTTSPTKKHPRIIEFMDITELSNHKSTALSLEQPFFQPTPAEVSYQNYKDGEVYKVSVALRNMDALPRRIKVLPSESPYFEIVAPACAGSKVAPGMEVIYKVIFKPNGVRDYADEIVCLTEREKFVIPVRTIGKRGVLDLPDSIHFPTSPVRHTTDKVLLVRNVGDAAAKFAITSTAPFHFQPNQGNLQPGAIMQVEANFTPITNGGHQSHAVVTYATGEETVMLLNGSAEDVNVRLEKSSLKLETTFIKHSCQRVIKLQNFSDVVVYFNWKATATADEEQLQRARKLDELEQQEQESDEFSQMLELDPVHSSQMSLLTRDFQSKRHTLAIDPLFYEDDVFSIEPCSGELWPNSETDVTVVFSPRDAVGYSRTVFCEVTGREARLPLKLNGEGVGPKLSFSAQSMALGSLFIGSQHSYELICTNTGDIDAPFKVEIPNTTFGDCFDVSPTEGVIAAGSLQVLRVVFRCSVLGSFEESIGLHISGAASGTAPSCAFQGTIIPPTFRFSKEEFDFGTVAYDFETTLLNSLTNTSLVPLGYRLRMPLDVPNVDDFQIIPSTGVLEPGERIDISVKFLPSAISMYDVYVTVDVVDVVDSILTIPVRGTSTVPEITLGSPSSIDFGRRFLGTEIDTVVKLCNSTGLAAKYKLTCSDATDGMQFDSTAIEGIIEADSTTEVDVAMTTRLCGELEGRISFQILGTDAANDFHVNCACVGEGPVVSIDGSSELRFGKQQILLDTTQTITLTNQSEIPATFATAFQRGTSEVFKCQPKTGCILPSESMTLTVTAHLNDTAVFADVLSISVENGRTLQVPMKAKGIGSVLVSQPALDGVVDLGNLYSTRESVREVSLRNGGTRGIKIFFTLDSPPPGVSGECTVMRGATFAKRKTPACPNPPDPHRSHFGIYPEVVTLSPNESATVELRGLSNSVMPIEEVFLCHGMFADEPVKKLIGTTRVVANFINPVLRMEPNALHFDCERVGDVLPIPQSKVVKISNATELSVSATISTAGAFTIVSSVSEVVIEPNGEMDVAIEYDPMHVLSTTTRTDQGTLTVSYAEHPQVDTINLSAQVNFPNLTLSTSTVDFGATLVDTYSVQTLTLTNPSPMPLEYQWFFESDHAHGETDFDANQQVFDITPTYGTLLPNATEVTTFNFNGHSPASYTCKAVCEVTNGPEYVIAIAAEATAPKFGLNTEIVEFDILDYRDAVTNNFELVNQCALQMPFKITVGDNKSSDAVPNLPALVRVEPAEGVLDPKQSVKFNVSLVLQAPQSVDVAVLIQVGDLPSQNIRVTATGVFPSIKVFGLTPEFPSPTDRVIEFAADQQTAKAKKRCVLQQYVVDFGEHKREVVMSKKIKVGNVGKVPASFTLNKKKLDTGYFCPFTVDTESVDQLANGEKVPIKVTFCSKSTSRMAFPLGESERTLVIELQDGNLVKLILRANVSESAVTVSKSELDFGTVKSGECRIEYMQVINSSPVACSWRMKPNTTRNTDNHSKKAMAAEARRVKIESAYEVLPSQGELPPQGRVTVAVRFLPTSDMDYTMKIPVYSDGVTGPVVDFKGAGAESKLTIDNNMLEMGPILPYGNSADASFTVSNAADFPIEFFSLEYDDRYAIEEAWLAAKVTSADAKNKVFLPPRQPGEIFPRELLNDEQRLQLEAADRSPVEPDTPAVVEATTHVKRSKSTTVVTATTPAVPEVKIPAEIREEDLIDMGTCPATRAIDRYMGVVAQRAKYLQDHSGFNAVVYGREYSDCQTHAAIWAQEYGAVVLQFDDIIEDAMRNYVTSELGKNAREYLETLAKANAEANDDKPPPRHMSSVEDTSTTEDDSVTTAATTDSEAAFKEEDDVVLEQPLPAAAELPLVLFEAIVRERFKQDDALEGVVVGGLSCKYALPVAALGIALKWLGKREHFFCVLLDITEEESLRRHSLHLAEMQQEMKDKAKFKVPMPTNVAEDAFEEIGDAGEKDGVRDAIADYKAQLRYRVRQQTDLLSSREKELQAQSQDTKKGKSQLKRDKSSKASGPRTNSSRRQSMMDMGSKHEFIADTTVSNTIRSSVSSLIDALATNEQLIDSDANASVQPPVDGADDGAVPLVDPFATHADNVDQLLQFWNRTLGRPNEGYVPPEVDEKGAKKKSSKLNEKSSKRETPITGADAPDPNDKTRITKISLDGSLEDNTVETINVRLFDQDGVPAKDDILCTLRVNAGLDPSIVPAARTLTVLPLTHKRPRTTRKDEFVFRDPAVLVKIEEQAKVEQAEEVSGGGTHSAKGKKGARPNSRGNTSAKKAKTSEKGRKSSGKKSASLEADTSASAVEEDGILKSNRWIVPANGQIQVHVRFTPKSLGNRDMTFSFETVLDKKQFSVSARGICAYANLSRSPQHLFSKIIPRPLPSNEIMPSQVYVESTNTFDFGAVLEGRSRDNYKNESSPANVTHITLRNPSTHQPVNLTAGMEHDLGFDCFTVDPNNAIINPGDSIDMRVWAYPKHASEKKDKLIVCISDNPDPIVVNVAVEGVKPLLEIEVEGEGEKKKPPVLNFDKVLINTKETRSLKLTNPTALPVRWKLLDQLEEFAVPKTEGIVKPKSTYLLPISFQPLKPSNKQHKFRISYGDADASALGAGMFGPETISMIVEAYDVHFALTYPKNDDHLDYKVLRPGKDNVETNPRIITLKNKGKFEIRYRFTVSGKVTTKDGKVIPASKIISIQPEGAAAQKHGVALSPTDKPTPIKIFFNSEYELTIKEQPLAFCEVIVSNHANQNKPVVKTKVPLKISACVEYGHFAVAPVRGINFGAIEFPSPTGKVTRDFVIENKGRGEVKYTIAKTADPLGESALRPRGSAQSTIGAKQNKRGPSQTPSVNRQVSVATGSKVVMGCFTVSPGSGSIPEGGSVKITVEADPKEAGLDKQMIEISDADRVRTRSPFTLPYSLSIEACQCSIETKAFSSIFAQYAVIDSLNTSALASSTSKLSSTRSSSSSSPSTWAMGLTEPTFVVDDNKFNFGQVMLGNSVTCKFRIENNGMVDCDVSLAVAPVPSRQTSTNKGHPSTTFTVDSSVMAIASHDIALVAVTFNPPTCHAFESEFTATIVKSSAQNTHRRGDNDANRILKFKVVGNGALPRVSIEEPLTRQMDGTRLAQFRKTRAGTSRTLPVRVVNNGSLPARVLLQVVKQTDDQNRAPPSRSGSRPGSNKPAKASSSVAGTTNTTGRKGTRSTTPHSGSRPTRQETAAEQIGTLPFDSNEDLSSTDGVFTCENSDLPVTVACGDSKTMMVRFTPPDEAVHNCTLRLCIIDNVYEAIYIQCSGEGHNDDVTIELPENMDGFVFPDTPITETSTEHFVMINTSDKAHRYEFPAENDSSISFEPQIGIIAPESSKQINCNFIPSAPCSHTKLELACKVEQVTLENVEMIGWDSSQKVVKWQVTEAADGRLDRVKIESNVPEPVVSEREAKAALPMEISAVSDFSKFTFIGEDNVAVTEYPHPVQFAQTMMYQRRTYTFTLRNDGPVRFSYNFHLDEDAMDADYMPFEVSPSAGVVMAQGTAQIVVTFAPTDERLSEALLTGEIGGCDVGIKTITVDLVAESSRPLCHFDLPPSDYIERVDRVNRKGQQGVEGQIFPDTKVIEIPPCSAKRSGTCKFSVINPTETDYNFKWTPFRTPKEDDSFSDTSTPSPFKCLSQSGVVRSGTKQEMVFQYIPPTRGAEKELALSPQESFWSFNIQEHGITVPFLVTSHVRESNLHFDKHSLNLVPLLVGQKVTKTLVLKNHESTPHNFSFSKTMLKDISQAAFLSVTPKSGTVAANAELPIILRFSPKLVQPYNFKVQCSIQNRLKPEVINVRCNAHAVKATLLGPDMNPMLLDEANQLDFGSISAFDSTSRQLYVRNDGDYNVEVSWSKPSKHSNSCLKIEPTSEVIATGATATFIVAFNPIANKVTKLCDVPFVCNVANGPSYKVLVSAEGRLPLLSWSSREFSFGKCFLHESGMEPTEKTVTVTNNDSELISIELTPDAKASKYFTAKLDSATVQPGESTNVVVRFTPTEEMVYKETLSFLINSKVTETLSVRGSGTPILLELEKSSDRVVKFGAVPVGEVVTKSVTIVNKGKLRVQFYLFSDQQHNEPSLSFTPVGKCVNKDQENLISLGPKDKAEIKVTFAPTSRIESLEGQELKVHCKGSQSMPKLLMATGSSPAICVELESDQLIFGDTVVNAQSSQRIMLKNTGDAGTKFTWALSQTESTWFSVTPKHGYLSAGASVPLNVVFHPTSDAKSHSKGIKFDAIKCDVEGMGEPLLLDVSGSITSSQHEKDAVHFSVQVRGVDTKPIPLVNKTKEPWLLRPVINHPYFSAESTITVEPGQHQDVVIKYHPLRMTQGKDAHVATVFMALPNGSSLEYSLVGHALSPKAVAAIEREVPCKVSYIEPLSVTNWLQVPQRFKVEIKKNARAEASTVLRPVIGEYIDVPAGATRDYKLEFFAHKEGVLHAEVIMRNEDTTPIEYLSYDLVFKATPPGVLDTIKLEAAVRTKMEAEIPLDNWVNISTSKGFAITCAQAGASGEKTKVPEVVCPSTVFGSFSILYCPLFEGERLVRLTATSPELGSFNFDLQLKALPALPMESQQFVARLGLSTARELSFLNYANMRTDYTAKIVGEGFSVPPSKISAGGHPQMAKFEAVFEPCQLGLTRATAVLTSKAGGTVEIPLVGECLEPEPTGPFVVKSGSRVTIPFTNCQNVATTFDCALDNEMFTVKQCEEYKPKQARDIIVQYDADDQAVVRTARLLVTCKEGACAGVEWVFYIKGIPSSTASSSSTASL